MKITGLFGLIVILAGVQMISAQEKNEFFLYLLSENIEARQLSRLDLKTIKPKGNPFLTTADIWSYLKDTHEMTLGFEATERLKKLKVPVTGRPFIVFVGADPVYTGAFWSSFSSISFRGVAVDVEALRGDFATIKLELDYPPLAPKNIASDPRPDKRILQALADKGVLYEQVWLSARCRNIKPTGKRRQSYIFTFDVVSVVKSTYDFPRVIFEAFDDSDQSLRTAVEAESNAPGENRQCNSQKEILLKFERQTNAKDPAHVSFRGFEPK